MYSAIEHFVNMALYKCCNKKLLLLLVTDDISHTDWSVLLPALPFGICVSQNIFQQRMDEILESLEGCVGIADEICIFGATQEEHDQRLIALMEVATSAGLVFNSTKCSINKSSISFFSNVYSAAGIGPYPTKVEDTNEMPVPQVRDDPQRVLGMVTYMGGFIPNLSRLSSILRDLLRKDVPFEWSEDHHMAFNTLKAAITTDASMAYMM